MRNMKRIVITGATSFIGSAVARALLARGHEVYGIVRAESKAKDMLPCSPRFHQIAGDMSNADDWSNEIGSADTFYHFAWGGPGAVGRADVAVQNQNVEDTMNCIRAAAKMNVTRFVFAGSQAEYGQTNGIITEETACNPILEYGKCKLKVCQQAPVLVKQLGMEYIHTRVFSVYGPGDHPYTLVPSCIRTFLAQGNMEMTSCEQKWNFLHVDDIADVFCELGNCRWEESSPVVNIASNDTRILRDYVEEIYELTGKSGERVYGGRKGGEKPVDNWPDTGKLFRITGWLPKVSFRQGISQLIELEKQKKGDAF